jgi:hypothetical protein
LWFEVTIHRMISLTLLLPCFYLPRRKNHLNLLKVRLDGPECQLGRNTDSKDDILSKNEAQWSVPQPVMIFPRQGFVLEDYIARPDGPWGPPNPMVTGCLPEVKRPGRGVNHPPHLAPRLKKESTYTLTFPFLHNEELSDLCSSPDIVWVIKSRRIRRADMWHTQGTGEMHTRFWWADLMERDYLQDRYRWEDNIKIDLQEVG